jgi:hypothetical protein
VTGTRGVWFVILSMSSALVGCVKIPSTYAPPMERKPVTGYGANSFGNIVSMSDASAPAHIVKDISPTVESGSWRWAFKRPEMRFAVTRARNVRLSLDLGLAKEAMDATGPVTLSYFVNGRLLEAVRYDQPGNKHYEKPVPADWLRTDAMNTVAIEIDKLFKSPQDGVQLGFILSRAGFIE